MNLPSDLPLGWASCTLSDAADLLRGVTYKKEDASDSPQSGFVPILRAMNISGVLTFDGLVYVPRKYVDDSQLIKAGDVIVAMSSGSRHLVGKSAQANTDYEGAFGAFCGLVRPVPQANHNFVGYFMQSPGYRSHISPLSSGININNLRREHIETAPLPFPPRNEQRRIVAKIEELFSKLDPGVAALEKAKALLKQYRQSALKAAVTGELTREWREANRDKLEPADQLLKRILAERRRRWEEAELAKMRAKGKEPKDDKWKTKYKEPNVPEQTDVPSGWIKCLTAHVITVKGGFAFKSRDYVSSGVPLIRIGDIQDGTVTIGDAVFLPEGLFDPAFLVSKGDLLIAMSGATTGKVGVYDLRQECMQNQRVGNLKIVSESTMIVEYRNVVFESLRKQIETDAYGGAQPNISPGRLESIPIGVPSVKEQEVIVREVDAKLSVLDKMTRDFAGGDTQLSMLRNSILQQAFTGQLVYQDPDDEPASVLLERIKAERATQGTGRRSRAAEREMGFSR